MYNEMINKFIVIFLLTSTICIGQSEQLGYNYFRGGEYEKAAAVFKELYEKNKVRQDYFKHLLNCYQLTQQFKKATALIESHSALYPNQLNLLVEKGYNQQLQNNNEEAKKYYEKALELASENPFTGGNIGRAFAKNHLIDYAIATYKKAMSLNPEINYHIYLAQAYGEKADIKNMFNSYLDLLMVDESYFSTIQRYIGQFITEDNTEQNNSIFRKLLLSRLQKKPLHAYNKLLSWLYIQQRDYEKAFTQEKALFKRNAAGIERLQKLGSIAFENKDYDIAKEIFQYILESTNRPEPIFDANYYLLKIGINTASNKKDFTAIDEKFKSLFNQFGRDINTYNLQLAYADFLCFSMGRPQDAIDVLQETKKLNLSQLDRAALQLKLADYLVFTNQFNQALILYTQIQKRQKNSPLAQEARFKVAKTSYYKGDFKWAMTQLKVLKKSTSQLIANDALELFLVISDNMAGDTVYTHLEKFAKADLLAYQQKNAAAIDTLQTIIDQYKGRAIEDEALFKQAQLFEKVKRYNNAEENYLQVLALDKSGILADNAVYHLGRLYEEKLNNPEKAKKMYEDIIFNYPASIYLIDARKRYRKLRGDVVN
ncbi:MAG: hypothetical protein CSA39_03645 [Flavobacteriales bacterium]|nr:MAG: hypothetical protein CSA39_03645 [Flavobacteriales bacterium]